MTSFMDDYHNYAAPERKAKDMAEANRLQMRLEDYLFLNGAGVVVPTPEQPKDQNTIKINFDTGEIYD